MRARTSDQARVTSAGLLVEGASTNAILYSRDATAVVWEDGGIATNCTRTATGMDGSTLVARCAAGSIQQVLTVATGSRTASAYVRCQACLSGSATISADGSTSTPATLSGSWQRIVVPYTSDGNITVTITSDQSFDVDYVQDEAGGFATSPIATLGTATTRASDRVTVAQPDGMSADEGCVSLSFAPLWTGNGQTRSTSIALAYITSSFRPLFSNPASPNMAVTASGVTASTPSVFVTGSAKRYASRWSASGGFLRVENLTTATSASQPFGAMTPGPIAIGSATSSDVYWADGRYTGLVVGAAPEACQ